MWFRRNPEACTYGVLKALKRADLLPQILRKKRLRRDPYQRFAKAPDEWGLLVRRNIIQRLLNTDSALQARLIASQGNQLADGSWGGTVSETALAMEKLLDLGVEDEDPMLTEGTRWLLSQFQDRIESSRLRCALRNLFTTPDHRAEYAATARILCHRAIARSCFVLMPTIQTALALRVLVRMGLAKDAKVESAFRSLLGLQTKQDQPMQDLPPMPIGCWCAHRYRRKLEALKRAGRPLRQKESTAAF
jgi:hypothetical protein